MAAQDSQRKVGVIPVLGAFSLIAAVGLILFLVVGSSRHGETTDLPSRAGVSSGGAEVAAAAGIDGGTADVNSGDAIDGGGDAATDSAAGTVTDSAAGAATGTDADTESGGGADGRADANTTSSGGATSGSSGSTGSGDPTPSDGQNAGTTQQGNGSQPSTGAAGSSQPSAGTSGPSPSSSGTGSNNSSGGSTSPGGMPSPQIQEDAEAVGIRIVAGDLKIMTYNTHQSGVTVVFYIPTEMRGFGTRSMIPPMTVAPTADGRSVTVQINCHSSANELLGQLSVSETDRQVLIAGAVVIPSGGAPCSGGAPLTVELPLRQPLGGRLLSVLPRT